MALFSRMAGNDSEMKPDLHSDIGPNVAFILVLAQYQGHSCACERDHVLIIVHVADGEVEACR